MIWKALYGGCVGAMFLGVGFMGPRGVTVQEASPRMVTRTVRSAPSRYSSGGSTRYGSSRSTYTGGGFFSGGK